MFDGAGTGGNWQNESDNREQMGREGGNLIGVWDDIHRECIARKNEHGIGVMAPTLLHPESLPVCQTISTKMQE